MKNEKFDRDDLISFFEKETAKMLNLMEEKNSDYSGDDEDPFVNFKMVGSFGCVTTEQGFFTRMTDKMSRISSFIKNGKLKVKDESVKDTLRDLANYSILFMAYLESTKKEEIKPEREEING